MPQVPRSVTMIGMNGRDVLDLSHVRRLARDGEARRIRVDAGLSLREVASAVGVSVAGLSRWELAQRSPHGRAAIRWGRLLAELQAVAK